jgi:hypothetical protein
MSDESNWDEDQSRNVKYARWILGGFLAIVAFYCMINGAMTTSNHLSLLHKTKVATVNNGQIWLGIALLYCAMLAGLVKTKGVGPKVGLGCVGCILFTITFFAYVFQAL